VNKIPPVDKRQNPKGKKTKRKAGINFWGLKHNKNWIKEIIE